MTKEIIKIGVIGYSAKSFPIYEAYNKILYAIEKAIYLSARYYITDGYAWSQVSKEEYRKHGICKIITYPKFEIISGLTDYGIPALTYCICESMALRKDYQIETVGFAPKCSLTDNICKVDKQIIVGENYGDESEEFVKYIDILIKVGGGLQSIKEAKLFKQLKPNNVFIEKKLKFYD